jgi:hypothetical protein
MLMTDLLSPASPEIVADISMLGKGRAPDKAVVTACG